ncbi:MAG: N-acetyl-gamma-glutamyl-phosphate reductase, partial [Clostridiaceae bacterium]|nr:N-acetyl-gamma-glutamyl-phosphate reductase [Clostridiaceae bacterium]
DFSGDYRYKDKNVYEAWYNEPHSSPELLEKSVYGLCELHRGEIKNSSLVGNPGCYPTCSILTLAPLVKEGLIDLKSIIIDAKSGVSGAGRVSDLSYSFCELTTKAYKVATHRHTSEIEQELSILADYPITLSFIPHLIPVNRGIYATCYANLNKKVTSSELLNLYRNFYKNEYFIRVKDTVPELKNVVGSNFVDISLAVDERLNRVIAVGALDNLIKGAAGQAVQNMNIMFGFDEKSGLETPAYYI